MDTSKCDDYCSDKQMIDGLLKTVENDWKSGSSGFSGAFIGCVTEDYKDDGYLWAEGGTKPPVMDFYSAQCKTEDIVNNLVLHFVM